MHTALLHRGRACTLPYFRSSFNLKPEQLGTVLKLSKVVYERPLHFCVVYERPLHFCVVYERPLHVCNSSRTGFNTNVFIDTCTLTSWVVCINYAPLCIILYSGFFGHIYLWDLKSRRVTAYELDLQWALVESGWCACDYLVNYVVAYCHEIVQVQTHDIDFHHRDTTLATVCLMLGQVDSPYFTCVQSVDNMWTAVSIEWTSQHLRVYRVTIHVMVAENTEITNVSATSCQHVIAKAAQSSEPATYPQHVLFWIDLTRYLAPLCTAFPPVCHTQQWSNSWVIVPVHIL
jgi:hypothetical protein